MAPVALGNLPSLRGMGHLPLAFTLSLGECRPCCIFPTCGHPGRNYENQMYTPHTSNART